jgi:hypothetical protein
VEGSVKRITFIINPSCYGGKGFYVINITYYALPVFYSVKGH